MTLLDEESSMLSLQGLKEREKPRLRLTRGEGRMVILLRWMVLGKIVVEREIAMDAQKHVMTIGGLPQNSAHATSWELMLLQALDSHHHMQTLQRMLMALVSCIV